MNDVAKEVFCVLYYFDNELIKKIPVKFLTYIKELATASNKEVNIDIQKELDEQNISEESKDLIALIYYSYIANKEEKEKIVQLWNENERIYQDELNRKYNPENIFKKHSENRENANNINNANNTNNQVYMTEYKNSILKNILNKIKRIFHIN